MEMETTRSENVPPAADTRYGYPSEWELFTLPPRDLSREKTTVVNIVSHSHTPYGTLRPDVPLTFNIEPNPTRYIDLKNMKLYLKLRILKSDGSELPEDEAVGLVNYPICSLFQQVDLYIQQTLIGTSGSCYPYKALFDVLLENDNNDINSVLKESLFFKDTSGNMDNTNLIGGDVNIGFMQRADHTRSSNILELLGKVHIDLARQERLLINTVQVTIKMSHHSEEFRLMRPEPSAGTRKNYKVEILTAILKVPMVKPTPAMLIGHNSGLEAGPCLYPFEKTEIRTVAIPSGMAQWPLDNLFLSHQPKRVVIAFVASSAFNGDYTKNPFNFEHFNLNYLCLSVDGTCIPGEGFHPDYENGLYLQAYDSIFSFMQDDRIGQPRRTPSITRTEYPSGYAMYLFNLDGGVQGEPFVNPQSAGLNKLEIKFAERLQEPVTVIIYATYNALMRIDISRNVRVDG